MERPIRFSNIVRRVRHERRDDIRAAANHVRSEYRRDRSVLGYSREDAREGARLAWAGALCSTANATKGGVR